MAGNGDIAFVSVLPPCDFCGEVAAYDAKTKTGPWAYMCKVCFPVYSDIKLGLGRGQRLVVRDG